MASTIIHIAIAKELKESLNIKNKYDYYIGTIIADLAINENTTRKTTHFLKEDKTKSLKNFIQKYPNYKENDFLTGYYIHLYTDLLWRKYIKNFFSENKLTLKNNQVLDLTREEFFEYIHKNSSHINNDIITNYNINLDIIIKNTSIPNTYFNEIDITKIPAYLKDLNKVICTKKTNNLIWDYSDIDNFIKETINIIREDI